jgi:hypothetical protein
MYTESHLALPEENEDLILSKLEQLSEEIDSSEDSLMYDLDYLSSLTETADPLPIDEAKKSNKKLTNKTPEKKPHKVDNNILIKNISNPIYNKCEEVF